MMRWEIPLSAKIVSFWSCGLQRRTRDFEPEQPHAADRQVKSKNNKKAKKLCHYHFKKSSICKPMSCVLVAWLWYLSTRVWHCKAEDLCARGQGCCPLGGLGGQQDSRCSQPSDSSPAMGSACRSWSKCFLASSLPAWHLMPCSVVPPLCKACWKRRDHLC